MIITLVGNEINSLGDFYKQLEPTLKTGECPWGANMDSLEEVVDMQFNYTNDSTLNVVEIRWVDAMKSQQVLGIIATLHWIRAKIENSTSADHKKQLEAWITQVEAGHSKTLYQLLTEILSNNPLISFKEM